MVGRKDGGTRSHKEDYISNRVQAPK